MKSGTSETVNFVVAVVDNDASLNILSAIYFLKKKKKCGTRKKKKTKKTCDVILPGLQFLVAFTSGIFFKFCDLKLSFLRLT